MTRRPDENPLPSPIYKTVGKTEPGGSPKGGDDSPPGARLRMLWTLPAFLEITNPRAILQTVVERRLQVLSDKQQESLLRSFGHLWGRVQTVKLLYYIRWRGHITLALKYFCPKNNKDIGEMHKNQSQH